MQPVKIAIIEDEEHPRNLLVEYINEINSVELTGTADDIEGAIKLISTQKPEIVLLDIDLYTRPAFEILEYFKEKKQTFAVIFTTAYSDFKDEALDKYGVEFSIFNYLLKPIDKIQLVELINRYKQKRPRFSIEAFTSATNRIMNQNIRIQTTNEDYILRTDDIVYCTSDKNSRYSKIVLNKEIQFTVSKSIGELARQFPPEKFNRIDQSTIINKKYYSGINKISKRCVCIKSNQKYEIPIAKSRLKSVIQSALSWFDTNL